MRFILFQDDGHGLLHAVRKHDVQLILEYLQNGVDINVEIDVSIYHNSWL